MERIWVAGSVIVFYLTLGSSVFAADPDLPSSGPLSGTSLYESVVKFGEVKGLTIGSGRYAGELINIVKGGYQACGFFGSNYFFHTRQDKAAETGPELLDPVGKGIIRFFQTLEKPR